METAKFHQTTLSNGLTIIGEEKMSSQSVGLGFFVKTGARDETPDIAGVSHFLEHMMFKGTDKRSAIDINFAFGGIGAQANAYTSEESTVYYAAVLPEYLPELLDILSDMLRPKLDSGEFSTEKKVILEEIALYQDRPTHVLFESALRGYFSDHPAGNSVLGSHESISALPVEKMREYFNRRYSPKNIVLTASGNFNWEELTTLAAKLCGHWVGEKTARSTPQHRPTESRNQIVRKDQQLAHICMLGPGPSANAEFRYDLNVLATILGDHSGSQFYWQLVDKGLAESASFDINEMDGTGFFMAYASAEPDRIAEVESIARKIISQAVNFSDAELERAKTKVRTRMVLSSESAMRRLFAVGNEWLYRAAYRTVGEEIQRLAAVNKASIHKALEEYPFKPFHTATLSPRETL
ncbi:insulinase family protein [bacterium]|nr:insulinase family protein [bacterium]